MNIVVLCGGTSTEREISLISGEGVCRALQSKGHHAVLIDVFLGHEGLNVENVFSSDFDIDKELTYIKGYDTQINQLKKTRKNFFGPNVLDLCGKSDVVFLGLHGANGEDGKVQAVLELFGIPYSGANTLSSAMAMSKDITRKIFAASNVPMPQGFTLIKGQDVEDVTLSDVRYPVVVKPSCGGSSVGVFYANNFAEYKEAVENAFEFENELIVEECVKGREFSVGIIEYEALPVIEIIPKKGVYDYKNKYTAGATDEICPAQISEKLKNKIQAAAIQAAKSLELDTYCRVDVLTDREENCYCLEANTLPGMTPLSLMPQEAAVVGIDYPSLCEKLIEVSLKACAKNTHKNGE